MPAQLGINGFGRFGMLVFRAASANPDVKVNAVNDPFMPLDYIVNQLHYDSVYERFNGTTNSIQVLARQQLGVVTFIVFSVSSKCKRSWRTHRCTAPRSQWYSQFCRVA